MQERYPCLELEAWMRPASEILFALGDDTEGVLLFGAVRRLMPLALEGEMRLALAQNH